MVVVILGDLGSLDAELCQTILHRRDVQLLWTRDVAEVRAHAEEARIVVVDGTLPDVSRIVAELREDASTRTLPIAVVARGDLGELGELQMIQAGADATLRLPPGPHWDRQLLGLMRVPVRREPRVPIQLDLTAVVPVSVPALVLNLSANGMRVLCLRRLRVGDNLQFSFLLPGRPNAIRGEAAVVRVVGEHQYGIELTRLDEEGRGLIRELLESTSNAF